MLSYKAGIPTGKKCEKCGQGELLERISRHGFFLGCSRYPDCDFIQDLSPELPEETGGNRRSSIATIAARRWPSSADALACFWPARAIRIARRRGAWWKARAWRASPTSRWTRSAPIAARSWFAATGAMANSSAARPIRSASSFARRRWASPARSAARANWPSASPKKGRQRVFYGCNRYPECDFTTPHLPIAEPCPKCGAPFIVEKRTKSGVVRACLKDGCDWEIAAPEELAPVSVGAEIPAKP